jgi:hypothetical protein
MVGISECGMCTTKSDDGLLILKIRSLKSEDANKFLNFLHNNGDKSANIVTAYFGEGDNNNFNVEEREQVKTVALVCFSIDGQAFYENIFPDLKDKILSNLKNNNGLLKKYKSFSWSSEQLSDDAVSEEFFSTSQIYQALQECPSPGIDLRSESDEIEDESDEVIMENHGNVIHEEAVEIHEQTLYSMRK